MPFPVTKRTPRVLQLDATDVVRPRALRAVVLRPRARVLRAAVLRRRLVLRATRRRRALRVVCLGHRAPRELALPLVTIGADTFPCF